MLQKGNIGYISATSGRTRNKLIYFWKSVTKINNNKLPFANNIDAVTEKWKKHYKYLLNLVTNCSRKEHVYEILRPLIYNDQMLVINTEVHIIISELLKGKAVGIDRLSSESLLYSDHIISVLLFCCFTGMLTHSLLPSSFMDTKIIPLVENVYADLSDINNYRPVSIANVLSNVFENILRNRCEEYIFTTDNHFGFKSGCFIIDLCIYSLRQYIDIFKSKRTT